MARIRTEAAPISWLHVVGMIVVLWAVSSETFAQAREVVVTEVRGTATRGNAAPLRTLDTLKVGDRVRLGSDSRVALFTAADARLYEVAGPGELSFTAKGLLINGNSVAAKAMSDAYRNLKISAPELVQGSMVMRNPASLRLIAPEGVVTGAAARRFSWSPERGALRFELATHAGDIVYRGDVVDGAFTLPADVSLTVGERYVWGVLPAQGSTTPLDWTEFTVVGEGAPASPAAADSSAERVLYAAWLKSQGMERAALRSMPGSGN